MRSAAADDRKTHEQDKAVRYVRYFIVKNLLL
jgi:hypothetical protein